jgi:hypothetical protein
MSAAKRGADQLRGEERLDRALTLLVEALNLIDLDEAVPEVGARLQGIIDSIETHRKRSKRSS